VRLLLSSPFGCASLHMVTDRNTECLTSRYEVVHSGGEIARRMKLHVAVEDVAV
jgi:hypothetical protein